MIRHGKTFMIGLLLMISFLGIYAYMMSPSFGNGRNGLQYADDMFNSLSKGSAYFIQEETKKAEKQVGNTIEVTVKAADPAEAALWQKLYTTAGATVKVDDVKVSINGDLGNLMKATLADCEAMYNNQGDKVKARYGYEAREATYAWYNSYKKVDTELKNQQKFKESSALNSVMKKGIEPSYNYYNIEIKHVKDNVGAVTFMLVFYLIYTMWYGFAIYFLCDGFGITMTKAAKKAEA